MDFARKIPVLHDPCNDQSVSFRIDEACLDIVSDVGNVTIWAQSVECNECDLVEVATLPASGNFSILRKTQFPWIFQATVANDSGSYVLCNAAHVRFLEYGRYAWNISEKFCSSIYPTQEPSLSPFSPILAVLTLLIGLTVVWKLSVCCYNSDWLARRWPQNVPFAELENDLGSPSTPPDAETSMLRAQLSPIRRSRCRVVSLDTFRGICITLMIFVNYGGGQYWFFKHSPWNGLTIADLVFPWFLWIMGTSLALSLRDQLRSCVSRRRLLCRVLRRSAALVALGVVLNSAGAGGGGLENLRLPGVLQRIGAAYCVVAILEVTLMKAQGSFQYGRLLVVQDLLDSWLQWLIVLALVAVHLSLTFVLGVPECPTGYLGPGGTHDHAHHVNCTGGAAGYLDRQVFGWNHIYQHPSCKAVYSTTVPYDPEGLLGTLTAVLMVYLGVQSGRIIMSFNYTAQRIRRWMVWATITGVAAGVLCNFSKNDGAIPVNKNLMSLSFVLALSSMAFVVQSVLYLAVDDKQWWGGVPFIYPGMNAILVYVGHEMTRNVFPWSWRPYYGTHWEHTLMDTWGTALWILIAYVLYRRKIFVSL